MKMAVSVVNLAVTLLLSQTLKMQFLLVMKRIGRFMKQNKVAEIKLFPEKIKSVKLIYYQSNC